MTKLGTCARVKHTGDELMCDVSSNACRVGLSRKGRPRVRTADLSCEQGLGSRAYESSNGWRCDQEVRLRGAGTPATTQELRYNATRRAGVCGRRNLVTIVQRKALRQSCLKVRLAERLGNQLRAVGKLLVTG